MKIETLEDGTLNLKEVFNPIQLESKNGNKISICMRDNGFEINYNDRIYEAKDDLIVKDGYTVTKFTIDPNKSIVEQDFNNKVIRGNLYITGGFKGNSKEEFIEVDFKPNRDGKNKLLYSDDGSLKIKKWKTVDDYDKEKEVISNLSDEKCVKDYNKEYSEKEPFVSKNYYDYKDSKTLKLKAMEMVFNYQKENDTSLSDSVNHVLFRCTTIINILKNPNYITRFKEQLEYWNGVKVELNKIAV